MNDTRTRNLTQERLELDDRQLDQASAGIWAYLARLSRFARSPYGGAGSSQRLVAHELPHIQQQ